MRDPDFRTRLLVEKHRLICERDALEDRITAMRIAIDALQKSPDAPAPQPEEAMFTRVGPPAAPKARAYVTRPAAAATGKKPAPIKKGAAEPISFNDLIAKAAEWGITEIHPHDLLATVNERAKHIGHPLYALQSRSP